MNGQLPGKRWGRSTLHYWIPDSVLRKYNHVGSNECLATKSEINPWNRTTDRLSPLDSLVKGQWTMGKNDLNQCVGKKKSEPCLIPHIK